jgi:four helix bundle protein
MQSFEELIVWQKAVDLVEHVYRNSRSWPRDEAFGLTSQVRRAAVSVPANIAEGQGRTGAREFLHHLSIAHGSLFEVGSHLAVAERLGFIDRDSRLLLVAQSTEISRLLKGLMKSLRSKIDSG